MEQVFFDDVDEGFCIPTQTERLNPAQLFLHSAATNNSHRIHYDKPYAQSEGHQDILVHGPLQAAIMARTLTDWAGPAGRLRRIKLQNRANAFPGEELRFMGRVTSKRIEGESGLVELDIWEEKSEGEVIMPGTATVELPIRGTQP